MKQRLTMFMISLFLFAGSALAQTKVSGTVLSQEDGQPIIGAAVKVDGTSTGMLTDVNGRFSLTLPEGKNQITISYLGYVSQTLKAKNNMRVFLKSDAAALDEVIVVAYGTQKKSAFTGSAAQVDAKKIEAHVASNVTTALAGAAPGVQLISDSGDPVSGAPAIRIRGVGSLYAGNAPLIILDGMPYDGNINSINPNDVESMTVLKDASASAIYGSRGANGVVLITTKKGRSQDAEIKLDAKWGSNSRLIPQYDVIKDPGQYYEMAYKKLYNSQIYAGKSAAEAYAFADANLLNERNGGLGYLVYTVPEGEKLIGSNFKLNPNATLGYRYDVKDKDGNITDSYYYTPDDWYDETFHNSFRQEYNLSFSGVTDRLNYYGSIGYLEDGGIVNHSKRQRYTARVNLDYQVKKWLKFASNVGYTHSDSEQPSYSSSWGSSGNLFYITNNMGPIYPLYVRNGDGTIKHDENGLTVYDANQTPFTRPSVVGNAVRDNEVNQRQDYRDDFNGKFSGIITPLEGLTLTASIGVSARNRRYNALYSQFGSQSATDGSAYVLHTRYFNVTNQYLANYRTSFAEDTHHLELLAGYEQYKMKYQELSGSNDHLYNPLIGELNNAGGSENKDPQSLTDNYMNEGFLGRVQYDYMEKYFISGSIRRDASSRFAPGHRWGTFGSFGVAWEMKKESFMDNVKWIDMLKLKASYGAQGNDNILDSNGYDQYYAYAAQYQPSWSSASGYSLKMTWSGNEELTWEKSKAFNIGVDFALFKNRLTGTLEYFSRKTSDMLYFKDVPLSSGNVTGFIPVNIGSMTNRGIEFNVDGVLVRNSNVEWRMNLNLTHYKNEITELDPSVAEEGIKTGSRILRIGGSIYNAYMRKYAGVDPKTGKGLYYYKEYEKNADGTPKTDENGKTIYTGRDLTTDVFSDADQYDLGTIMPTIYGGLGTTVNAYGFDFSAQLSFQLGGKVYDSTYQALMHTQNNIGSAWHKDAMNAWSYDNQGSDIPRLDGDTQVGQTSVDRFLVSSDYLSINNVQLGYTFPKKLISPLTLSALRVYVAVENLAVISARKGLDPRFSMTVGGYSSGMGMTTSSYSAMRTITAGLTVSF